MAETRVTQVVAETLVQGTPQARANQVVVETLVQGTPQVRAHQVVVEVVVPYPIVAASQARSFVVWVE